MRFPDELPPPRLPVAPAVGAAAAAIRRGRPARPVRAVDEDPLPFVPERPAEPDSAAGTAPPPEATPDTPPFVERRAARLPVLLDTRTASPGPRPDGYTPVDIEV